MSTHRLVPWRRSAGAAAALTAAFLLAACGSGDDAPASSAATTSPSSSAPASTGAPVPAPGVDAAHNGADVAFAQNMIVHHRQAIDMARMGVKKATDPSVKELAAFILNAQQGEVEQMSNWLTTWAQPVPSRTGAGGHAGHDMTMPGTMTQQDMDRLEQATGADFDRMFLERMIPHHQGAIDMARQEQTEGQNPRAKQLAENVVSEQSQEIADMQEILGR